MASIKSMQDGVQRKELLEQAFQESPKLYKYCMNDYFCGG